MVDILELKRNAELLPLLESHHRAVVSEIAETKGDIETLLHKHEKENNDVVKLENASLSAFLLKLVGLYDDKLQKEVEEEINAKTTYDNAVAYLELLEQQRLELNQQISEAKKVKMKYQRELNHRKEMLGKMTSALESLEYKKLLTERNDLFRRTDALERATRAAEQSKDLAKTILRSLNKADGWASFDVWAKGRLISDLIKYSHIDDAESDYSQLRAQVRKLKNSLKGVGTISEITLLEIDKTDRTFDIWCDGFYSSRWVQQSISMSIYELNTLLNGIKEADKILQTVLPPLRSQLQEAEQKIEAFLISMR